MLIFGGLILFAYGYALLSYKDFWWWDHVLFFQMLGKAAKRTTAWDLQLDIIGGFFMFLGVVVSFYAIGTWL